MSQVTKEHYDFSSYLNQERWNSYYSQIKRTVDENIKNVLVIGVGDGFVPTAIKAIDAKINVVKLTMLKIYILIFRET